MERKKPLCGPNSDKQLCPLLLSMQHLSKPPVYVLLHANKAIS